MARYIDADVLNECMSIVQKANRDSIEFNKRCRATDVFQDIWGMIKAQPTADVRENVKGEWKDRGLYAIGYMCSYCQKASIDKSDYCPNCGAAMRKGV